MLPARFDAETVPRIVTDLPRQRPQRGAGKRHVERDGAGASRQRCRGFARGHAGARHQSGGEHRAAQVVGQAALIDIAGAKPGDLAQVVRREEPLVAARHRAESVFAAGDDGQRQIALLALMIDEQVGLADFGKGIAGLTKLIVQRGAPVDDLVARQRIAGGDAQAGAQRNEVGTGRRKIAHVDRAEAVAHAGDDVETHARSDADRTFGIIFGDVASGYGLGHLVVVIAVCPQQLFQQSAVGTGARRQLRDRGLVEPQLLDRR